MGPALRLVPPALALTGVTYGLARYAFGLFLPAIRGDVALTPALSGLIGAGSYAGYCIAVVVSTLLAERLGSRGTAALAGSVAAIGMAAVAFASSPVMLAAAVLFAGLGGGLASPPLAEAVAARIAATGRDRANALISSGTSAGVALSGPIALVSAGAWRGAYLLFAAVAACVTLWIWLALPPRAPARGNAGLGATARVLRRAAARPLALAAFGAGVSSAIYWTFAGEAAVAAGGLPASVASAVWVVVGLSGFAGGMAGDLVGRYGAGAVHRASLVALAAAVAGTGFWPGVAVVVYAGAALFGASYMMLAAVYLVWGVGAFADRPAVGLGLPFLAIALGQAVGASVAGVALGMLGYGVSFALFAGVALASGLIRPMKPGGPCDSRHAAGLRSWVS